MLCHLCQNLVFVPAEDVSVQNADWLTELGLTWLVSVHQPSRKSLELSAGQGCRVCALIWFQLFYNTGAARVCRDGYPEAAPVLLFMNVRRLPYANDFEAQDLSSDGIALRYGERLSSLRVHKPVSDEVSTILDLSCVLSSRPEAQYAPIGSAIDNHTGSAYNMDLIKTWIQDCQRRHLLCDTEVSSEKLPLLPTRVIELEIDGQARIIETMGLRAEYLTLSYCWGQGKKLLCVSGSGLYEKFKQKLPVDDSMPKTFRDAFQVTRALGYRYLWIDALCIIQDDPNDVGKEMAKMGGIYQQSTLNILADSGSDTDAGLFCERDARGRKSCNVQMTLKQDSKSVRTCRSIHPWAKGEGISALKTRGWVLQEELLPGRSLKFGHTEVSWSCTTTYARENDPCMEEPDLTEVSKSIRRDVDSAMRLIVRRPDTFDKALPDQSQCRRNHFDVWYEMIGNYSRRALSVDSDKLLAVAGLASLMGEHYRLTYVTGLWKEDLQVGLCWSVTSRNDMFRKDGPRSITEDFPDYLAPTWSWASAHSMCVKFHRPRLDRLPEEELQVIDVEVSHLPGALATFGYIKFAKLSVCTKMRRILLAPCEEKSKLDARPMLHEIHAFDTPTASYFASVSVDSVKVYEDILRRYPGDRLLTKIESAPKGPASETFRTHQLSSDGYEAWCVPCLVQKDNKGNREMITLVLTPLNAVAREYRRIGIMGISHEACNKFMAGEDLHEDREIIHIL